MSSSIPPPPTQPADRLAYAWTLVRDDPAQAITLVESLAQAGHTPQALEARNIIARARFQQGRYAEAVSMADAILSLCGPEAFSPMEAAARHTRGLVLRVTGRYDESLKDHLREMEIRQHHADRAGEALALLKLGALHAETGAHDTSQYYSAAALDIYRDLDDRLGIATALNSIAADYGMQGKHDLALEMLLQARGILLNTDEHYQRALVVLNIGTAYGALERWDEAETALRAALAMAEEIGAPRLRLDVLNSLCMFYRLSDRPDPERAFRYVNEAIELAEALPSVQRLIRLMRLAAAVEAERGNHERAYELEYRAHDRYKEHFNAGRDQRVQLLEVLHRTEISKREAEQLREKNDFLASQAAEQAASHQRLNRLKDEFIFNTSHDLKTPLTSLMLAVDMLRKHGQLNDARGQHLMKRIEQSSDEIRHLISDVLDLARLEVGSELQRVQGRVQDLFNGCQASFQTQLEHKGLAVVLDLKAPDLMIYADFDRLSQAVNNLLSNAIKYSSSGTITLRAYQREALTCIEVEDTGIGIESQHLPRIFDHFYRVNPHGSRTEGTGLGLSIVRTVVERHGGHINVTSTPGQGTRVTLCLPGPDAAL